MKIKFKHWDCTLEKAQYHNGRIALRLIGTGEIAGEPVAVATVNIVDDDTQPNELAIKDWSENEGMYQAMLDASVVTPAHRYTSSGWIEAIPVCYLTNEAKEHL